MMKGFKVLAVNISEKKGNVKHPVNAIRLTNEGIEGDAHAGKWHRQISMLAQESIDKAGAAANETFPPGTFAENITTSGFEIFRTAVFDRFVCGDVTLEVTQLGKKCHTRCEIGKKIGDCIMPVEGIFCRVLQGGEIKPGDFFEYQPRVIQVKVITVSDRAYKGIYKDLGGPKVQAILSAHLQGVFRAYNITNIILPDDPDLLGREIKASIDQHDDLLFTTGGTGVSERDITPETVRPFIKKELPGIMEHIRMKYGNTNPNALVSRSIAGVNGQTQIYCLPGSVNAISEYMQEITPTLEHLFRMLFGIDWH